MYNNTKEKRKVILPTNDLNFKRLFASPRFIHISKGFLQDLAAYDPLGLLQISALSIETPYNFQEVNRIKADHERAILNTEVDYACCDENGDRFLLEMQKRDQTYLEERVTYNIGQKFAQNYAGNDEDFDSKYASLKPVIAVIILADNHFKEDDIAIRFLRPYDVRYGVYKNNLNLGLEIYVEIKKDASKLPKNLQLWMEYFKTGKTLEEAPCYLQEAVKMSEITSFTKEERELADLIEKLEQKRICEDEAVRLNAKAEADAIVAEGMARIAEAEERVAETEERMAETEERMAETEERMAEAEERMAEAEERMAEELKQGVEQERKRAEAEKFATIERLLKMGLSNVDIAQAVGVTADVVLKVWETRKEESKKEI